MKKLIVPFIVCLLGSWCDVQGAEVANSNRGISPRVQPFDLREVRLLDGPCKEIMERNRRWLLDIDLDRLLHNFRVNAGLPTTSDPLGGWASPDHVLRGTFVGHYLTACSMLYASTGDKAFQERTGVVVTELKKCQEALDADGYLGAFPVSFFDYIEAGEPGLAGISTVSWYVIHKIMAGLYDAYRYCDDKQALSVVERMAQWAGHRISGLTEARMQELLDIEHGGMLEILLDLYKETGRAEYFETASRFEHKRLFDPFARHREDVMTYLHGNSTVPKILGAVRFHELTGQTRYRTIAEYFWDRVVHARSYATGGSTNFEHWPQSCRLAKELSSTTAESCVSYNMLKLTRALFAFDPRPELADYAERTLWNHILGAQNPEDGSKMYYVPMATGYWKDFPSQIYSCCTSTLTESYTKLADSIYYHDADGIYVNLFIASQLNWADREVRLRQETRFPDQSRSKFTFSVKEPVDMALRIRVPYWATRGGQVKLNGRPLEVFSSPSSYLTITRTWADGDSVQVEFPMALHAWPMPDDDTILAIMFGPLVLAGQLGTEGMTEAMIRGQESTQAHEPVSVPPFVAASEELDAWIRPVPGSPLTFRTVGQERDVTFVPIHRLFGQRYGLYWKVFRKDGPLHRKYLAGHAEREARRVRTVDKVINKASHGLGGHGHHGQGSFEGETYRRAERGGWFSYNMAVLPDQPMELLCTYWGGEGGITFDILIDETRIATQSLSRERPDEYFDVTYPIPGELTRGKDQVTVTFKSPEKGYTGMIFHCATMVPEEPAAEVK